MLLNRKYQVIAHSDVAEVGRSYLSEEGGFGSELVKALRETEGRYFSLRFGGAEYIVYREPVANDWLCLSVFDATSVFSQMRNTLIFTIVAVLLVVAKELDFGYYVPVYAIICSVLFVAVVVWLIMYLSLAEWRTGTRSPAWAARRPSISLRRSFPGIWQTAPPLPW